MDKTEQWRRGWKLNTAAVFGKIDSFEEGKETWEHYCERLGHYFIANGIGNIEEADLSKRQSNLLCVCGSKMYKLMSDLLAPNKPGTKPFAELVKLVQDHYIMHQNPQKKFRDTNFITVSGVPESP